MSVEFINIPPPEFVGDDKSAQELLRLSLRKVEEDPEDFIGFDTETHGLKIPIKKRPLDPLNDTVTYWSLSFKMGEIYRRWCIAQEYFLYFSPLLESPKLNIAGWNIKYDAHISWNCGVNIWNARRPVDGMVLAQLLDENRRSHGLKSCASDYCGLKMTPYTSLFDGISDSEGKKAREYETSLIELVELGHEDLVSNYASYDAYAHLRTVEWLIERLTATPIGPDGNLWEYFLAMEMDFTELLWRMERRGMHIDVAHLESRIPIITKRINGLEREICREAGYPININSPKQLAKFFFGHGDGSLGLKPVKMTATQQPSTDEEVMKHLVEAGVEVAKLVVDCRKLHKSKSTYLDALIAMSRHFEDGRIHPNFNQMGARTGRLSSENPNSMNFPRPAQDEWGIRKAFTAPPGKKLIVADYCVDKRTRIFTQDLRWIPAGDIKVGDKLIGFDEELSKSKYRPATVTKVRRVQKPRYLIKMSNGAELTVSADHQWVTGGGGGTWKRRNRQWVSADQLEVGDRIAYFMEPWEAPQQSYELGYLAGALDGEGWVGKSGKVGFAQRPNECLDCVEKYLSDLPLDWSRRSRSIDDVQSIEFYGNKGGLRALGMIRPERLLTRAERLWKGKRTWSSHTPKVYVTSIQKLRKGEVVAIETDTHTFIAEGFLSHNCQIEMRIMADFSGDKTMVGAILEGKDLHSFTVALTTPGVKYEEVVAAKKAGDKADDRQLWLQFLRQAKKAVGFGIIYGAGPPKISTEIEISEEDWMAKLEDMPDRTFQRRVTRLMKNNPLLTEDQAVEKVGRHSVAGDKIAEYFDAYPGVKGFMDQTPVICRHRMHFDEENQPRKWDFEVRSPGAKPSSWSGHHKPFGYVQTLCGRYRRLEDIDHKNYFYRSEAERQSVNTPIQGSAADITKTAMLRIEHHPKLHMLGVLVLNQIHDEIVMEVPEENAEIAAPIIQHCMEHPFGDGPEDDALRVPIPVDLKIVSDWASAK